MRKVSITNWAKLGTVAIMALFGSMVSAQDVGARIAFVNAEKIFVESNMAKAAQARLQNEFAKRQNEIRDGAQKIKATAEKLDRDAAVMSEAERIRRQRELADQDGQVHPLRVGFVGLAPPQTAVWSMPVRVCAAMATW